MLLDWQFILLTSTNRELGNIMRYTIFSIVILITWSCSHYTDCYDCYIDQYPDDQKAVLIELENFFEDFLIINYPECSSNEERLRTYCKDILDTSFREKIDKAKIEKILNKYRQFGLDKEIRDLESETIFFNPYGLYIKAQHNCLKYDYQDSLVYNYVYCYEELGGISPGRFVEYIAFEAENNSLQRRILHHQFIMEFFVPRMKNK